MNEMGAAALDMFAQEALNRFRQLDACVDPYAAIVQIFDDIKREWAQHAPDTLSALDSAVEERVLARLAASTE